jgi:peptidoglycan/LPS O-acetylase OafA/YrhL
MRIISLPVFGTFRFSLAMIVVLSHLWLPQYIGHYAVFGFYVLSGYLITFVMNERYGYTASGFLRFSINRAIRIYPGYLAAAGLSLALIGLIGPVPSAFLNEAMRVPDAPASWLPNIALLGLTSESPARLVPPAWALAIELAFYSFIALGLGRSKVTAIAWAGTSILLTVWWLVTGVPYAERYPTLLAASLPFSLGSLVYHYRHGLQGLARPVLFLCIVSGYLSNLAFAEKLGYSEGTSFYLSLCFSALLVAALTSVTSRCPRMLLFDQILGNLSYPVYLLHWQAATIVWAVTGASPRSVGLLLTTIPVVLTLATLLHVIVESRFDKLRSGIKNRAVDRSSGASSNSAI